MSDADDTYKRWSWRRHEQRKITEAQFAELSALHDTLHGVGVTTHYVGETRDDGTSVCGGRLGLNDFGSVKPQDHRGALYFHYRGGPDDTVRSHSFELCVKSSGVSWLHRSTDPGERYGSTPTRARGKNLVSLRKYLGLDKSTTIDW